MLSVRNFTSENSSHGMYKKLNIRAYDGVEVKELLGGTRRK